MATDVTGGEGGGRCVGDGGGARALSYGDSGL